MQQVSIDGVKKMWIDHEAGVIYDAIAYTTNYFNKEKVRAAHSIFVKNEDDIFANYYEFKKHLGSVPSDSLYFFFIFNAAWPNVMIKYFDNCFPDYAYTFQAAIREIKDIEKFKVFAYRDLLEHYKNKVDVEAVINGEAKQIALAVAFLAKDHPEYAMYIHMLFYEFEDLLLELVNYLEFIFDKVNLYHIKKERIISKQVSKAL